MNLDYKIVKEGKCVSAIVIAAIHYLSMYVCMYVVIWVSFTWYLSAVYKEYNRDHAFRVIACVCPVHKLCLLQ